MEKYLRTLGVTTEKGIVIPGSFRDLRTVPTCCDTFSTGSEFGCHSVALYVGRGIELSRYQQG